jgi:putative intracellular protease/amidase
VTLLRRVGLAAALSLSLFSGLALAAESPKPAAHHYVCVPCGLPCDDKVFDKPGTCPDCGMPLVEQGSIAKTADTRHKIAILLFNGVQIIDYTGPYEMFGAANFNVYTVAASKDPITTSMGMTVVPKYDFASAPLPDVLVVPGGGVRGAMNDSSIIEFVKATAARAPRVMSVCNGAFILGQAGLLDGLTATTTYGNVLPLRDQFPKVKVVGDRRFVDNGHIITTGGLSAGIDGALHVISLMDGEQQARNVALQEEYDWRPSGGYLRPAMADRMTPRLNFSAMDSAVGQWALVSSAGDANHWELVLKGGSKLDAEGVLRSVGKLLVSNSHWTPAGAAGGAPGAAASEWTLEGLNGEPWHGRLEVSAVPASPGQFTAKVAVTRAT